MTGNPLVDRLERSINAGDVDATMDLFAADPVVSIPALSTRSGATAVRELFDFCAGINVKWHFDSAVETEDEIVCRVDQFDGWSTLIGIAPLQYESFRIWTEGERITRIEGTWSEPTLTALGESLEGFTPWAVERHPELYGPDGDFNYTREAGEGFIAAAREWLDA